MLFTSALERIGSQFLMILLTADLETLIFLAILVMGGFGTVECKTIISFCFARNCATFSWHFEAVSGTNETATNMHDCTKVLLYLIENMQWL